MQGAFVGNGVVGLHLVGVPKGVGYPVVEILNRLFRFLSQVLEADAECLGRVLGCVSLQELRFEVVPVVFVEPDDVVKGVVPGQGVLPEGEGKLVATSLIVGPLGDPSRFLQSLDILLGLNGILTLLPVKEWDICGPPDPIMVEQGCLKCSIRHRERSVVRKDVV
jgi:hypothetical protein